VFSCSTQLSVNWPIHWSDFATLDCRKFSPTAGSTSKLHSFMPVAVSCLHLCLRVRVDSVPEFSIQNCVTCAFVFPCLVHIPWVNHSNNKSTNFVAQSYVLLFHALPLYLFVLLVYCYLFLLKPKVNYLICKIFLLYFCSNQLNLVYTSGHVFSGTQFNIIFSATLSIFLLRSHFSTKIVHVCFVSLCMLRV
jgi:hypothetical protein